MYKCCKQNSPGMGTGCVRNPVPITSGIPKVYTIQQICDFFEVECSEDYLQQCYDKTFKTLSRSRDLESRDSKDGRGRLKGVPLPQDY